MGYRSSPKVKINWSKLGGGDSTVYRQLRDIVHSAGFFQSSINSRRDQRNEISTKGTHGLSTNTTLLSGHAVPPPSPPPATSTRSMIPHWSYEKSSIAAACIFTTIVFAALSFLVFLAIKRIRKKCVRHQRHRQNGTPPPNLDIDNDRSSAHHGPEGSSAREQGMFSDDRLPSQQYMVKQKGGSVTRVYHECQNQSNWTFDSVVAPAPPKKTLQRKRPVLARNTQPVSRKRQAIVTPPPTKRAKAREDSQRAESRPYSSLSKDSSVVSGQGEEHESQAAQKERLPFRLPSLQRNRSPIF
ncbi:hypothetical protein FE257_012139 [Aspergillus nanangensis]|uniref:Uncharacterized protein n=1 Tax=Aspergillus nanangensis TaxID=2582783 RepID=A0AAD4CGE2_ASPNN|nr:hypothetical protein FE257_012139 [Aspergillus nanangensis]